MRETAKRGTTRRVRARLGVTAVVCTVVTVLPGAASAEVRTVPGVANDGGAGVERVSVAADGTQGDGDEVVSAQPATAGTDAVGSGGREVVFHSTADDIVPGDTNGKSDVFLRRFS